MDFKKYYNLNQKFYKDPLFILISITVLLTLYLLSVQIRIGVPYFDVFNYLNNGLYFAGMGNGNFLYLPPLIPILNAIFFKLGYVSINTIFIISSIFFVIGVIGLYLLLNQRFNKIESFTGSIIFISFPIIISWAASGGIDIPGITFAIWAVYFTVLGLKKNSKLLYLVLPIIMLSFITRYTSGLILFPVLFYVIINIKQIKNLKKIMIVTFIEVIALISSFILLYTNLGTSKDFYSLLIYILTSNSVGVGDVAYNPDPLYYIQHIPNYISISPFMGKYFQILNPSNALPSLLAYIIVLIVIIGLLLYIYRVLDSKLISIKNISPLSVIKIILLLILIPGLITTFNNVSFFISEIIFFFICFVSYLLLKSPQSENLDLDITFLSWFGAYLIFHSVLAIKVDRYFITMAPAFIYFIILGLKEVTDKIKPKIKNENLKSWGIYLVVALIFLSSSTATYIGHIPKKCFTLDIEDASNWLKDYDPNYKDKRIYSDYGPAASWYLKRDINGGFPLSMTQPILFSRLLQKENVDYYMDSLSQPKPEINGYHIIKITGQVAVYEKTNQ